MKTSFILILLTLGVWGGFDFGECSGSGSFEQQIEHYQGDYENAVTVGNIPAGIEGFRIELVSNRDVDIRLYSDNGGKIVHWPFGLLHKSYRETKNYMGVDVTYSGYNGVGGHKGHEYIEVAGATPIGMTMKAFGYRAGYARVNYSWTGKVGCAPDESGSGSFQQNISYRKIELVGVIPQGISNLEINLTSTKDIDIQLYGEDGTPIVKWPNGLLNGPALQTIEYHGMQIEWSGYNGVNGEKGHEYIKVRPATTEALTMKVFGYQRGYAEVTYRWGNSDTTAPVITLLGDANVTVEQGSLYVDAGAVAMDDVDGNITDRIVVTNPVDTSTPGVYTVRYNVADTAGNQAEEVTRRVEVLSPPSVQTQRPLLVLRVEFNDFQFTQGAAIWHDKIFGTDEGELNDYFDEVSYGKFQFVPANETDGVEDDGIITIQLNENHPDVGGNDIPAFASRLVNAVTLADSSIDFAAYDQDHNGKISRDELQIIFLVAGGESATGTSPGIWAHAWCLDASQNVTPPVRDGVRLMACGDGGNYALFGEKHGTRDASMGIIAHELGHAAFSLPDLYDTDGSSMGIGDFGLMGSGSWSRKPGDTQAGETPVHMTGWSKMKAGFVTPDMIDSNISGLILNATSLGEYMLYKIPTGAPNEYFLIENRGASGYDMGLSSLQGTSDFTGGLLVLHIDENQQGNADETHKLVDVEEANNVGLDTNAHRGHVNNLYFNGNAGSFSDTTTPNTNRYDGTPTGIKIENISDSASIMTVDIHFD